MEKVLYIKDYSKYLGVNIKIWNRNGFLIGFWWCKVDICFLCLIIKIILLNIYFKNY